MSISAIKTRYAKEVETAHCGCANLWPYIDIQPGMSVLDLGSGNGIQTYSFANKASPGKVYGLDITEEMLAKARETFKAPNLNFIAGDIAQIPLSDNSIDLVTSNCVINHASDKNKVYQEIYRVLKPQGQFVIGDVCALDTITPEEANDPQKIAECWGGSISRENYLKAITECGFSKVEICTAREYHKAGHLLESIIVKGVKQ